MNFLTHHYPAGSRRRRREAGDVSEEPLAQRARAAVDQVKSVDTDRLAGVLEPSPGEDLDDEVEKFADADADEPTERQKRE